MAVLDRLRSPLAPHDPGIRTLLPDDVPLLRLGRQAVADEVHAAVASYPGRSVWLPHTLEYVVVTPWRNREAIGFLGDVSAIRHAEALIRAACERARAIGDAMTLMIDLDEERPRGFYRRAALDPIERIVTYELRRGAERFAPPGAVRFIAADPGRPDHLQALMEIDRAAFPWLWWNTPQEFAHYGEQMGVELYLGFLGDTPVSYCGFTVFLGWAHLDRIAVRPDAQGRGVGRDTLAFAIRELFRIPVDRIGLSTQELNERSRRLYEACGFRRSPGYDYCLYGTPHREPALALTANATEF
ncbi:MAG: GNAT family N-acetyltransferase [Chloroflexota bacterium]